MKVIGIMNMNIKGDGLQTTTYGGDAFIEIPAPIGSPSGTEPKKLHYTNQKAIMIKNNHNFNEIHVPLKGMRIKGSSRSYIKSEY